MTDRPESILSHGERDVAGYLREGADVGEIAAARGTTEASVRETVDRIEEKTRRAAVTLAESPSAEDAAGALDEATRRELLDALRRAHE